MCCLWKLKMCDNRKETIEERGRTETIHLFPLSQRWHLHVWHLPLEFCPCQSGTVPQALWWIDWCILTHTTDFWDFHQQPPNEEEVNSRKKMVGGFCPWWISVWNAARERTPTANLMVRSKIPDEVKLVPAGLTFSDFRSKYFFFSNTYFHFQSHLQFLNHLCLFSALFGHN